MRSMKFSGWILGAALLGGVPAARALAAQPPEGEVRERAAPPEPEVQAQVSAQPSAEATAVHWQSKADQYHRMGGAAYRLGLVQNANTLMTEWAFQAALLRARAAADPANLRD